MKVLMVCSGNSGDISPFTKELAESVRDEGVHVEYFPIEGKGALGYLKNLVKYNKLIKKFKPDIVHAHYGLSALFANIQHKTAVVSTFHGSDVNTWKIRAFSLLAMKLSKHNIFVSAKLAEIVFAKKDFSVIPCGIDLTKFFPIDKKVARAKLAISENEKVVVFSGSFAHRVKNYPLARSAVDSLKDHIKLLELKGYSREKVNLLLNASDVALMTSFAEGSPQFIKEAMACNCPIVSTDVGDVKEVIGDTEGCYICAFDQEDVAKKIGNTLNFGRRTNGQFKIRHFDKKIIVQKVIEIYDKVLDNNDCQ